MRVLPKSLSTNALAAAVGIVADLAFGELAVEPHPVAAFGTAMERVEHTLFRPRRVPGVVHAVVGVGLGVWFGAFAAWVLSGAVP